MSLKQILLLGFALGAIALLVALVLRARRAAERRADLRSLDELSPPPREASTTVIQAAPGERPAQAPQAETVLRELLALSLGDVPLERLDQGAAGTPASLITAAAGTLDQLSVDPQHLPRRPALLPKLLQALNDEASLRALARIIEQDPALTGNLLRVANSPYYRAGSQPVESIERAITLMGTQGVRALIALALVQPVLARGEGPFGIYPERAWEYTTYLAAAAEAHANRVEQGDGFAAQLGGLLYGLGSIVVFRVLREQYASHPELLPDAGAYAVLIEARTAPTARRIAVAWELSEEIAAALGEQADKVVQAALSPLARSLRFGRIAGALVMLCRYGRLDEGTARATLLAAYPPDPRIEETWERLAKAYIQP